MKLTGLQEECLRSIKGDKGIVCCVSKIVGNSGKFVPTGDNLIFYDELARVFFKASYIAPLYTSVIGVDNQIYVSYVGKPPVRAMTKEDVSILVDVICKEGSSGVDLIKFMCRTRNDILQNILILRAKQEKAKLHAGKDNQYEFFSKVKNFYTDSKSELLEDPIFNSFASETFQQIFTDFAGLQSFLRDKKVDVIEYTDSKDHPYFGVHVEVKGIHFAKSQLQHKDSKVFNIGLAHTNKLEVGCCTGCDAELNAFALVKNLAGENPKYEFHRSGNYPENFAKINYQPSQLVTGEANSIFIEFAKDISSRCHSAKANLAELGDIIDGHIFTLKYKEMFFEWESSLGYYEVQLGGADAPVEAKLDT